MSNTGVRVNENLKISIPKFIFHANDEPKAIIKHSMLTLLLQTYYCQYAYQFIKSAKERATRVRTCNYIKIETGQYFLPVLKIVTCTAQAA